MCIVHKEVVKLFKWYQCPTTNSTEKVILPEEFVKYHRLDTIYMSYSLDNGMSEQISQALLKEQENVAARYSIYRDISVDLSAKLQKENIRHVFIKGIVLAEEIYVKPWHRYFADLDLLVDKDHLSTVEDILNNMGYQYGFYSRSKNKIYRPTRAEILFQRTYTHEMYKMCRMETNTFASHIDVNFLFKWRGVNNHKNTYSVSDLTDHIVLRNGLPTFDSVATMVHLCCHLYNQAYFFALDRGYSGGDPREILLIRVFDIALLAKRLSNDEFNTLVLLAKQMNCIDEVRYSLGLANLLLNLDIGHDIDALNIESEEIYAGYCGKDQKYYTWPISICDRVFDLEKKREVSETLFPLQETQ